MNEPPCKENARAGARDTTQRETSSEPLRRGMADAIWHGFKAIHLLALGFAFGVVVLVAAAFVLLALLVWIWE